MIEIISGERAGGFLVLTDVDGIRHAIRLGSVLAVSDADGHQDTAVVVLPGGRAILIAEPLERVLEWLGSNVPRMRDGRP